MKPINKREISQKISKTVALALAGAMVVGGASAYLTDAETADNVFTVGEVMVDLLEENYPGNDSPDVQDLIPYQEVAKDPVVKNTGENDAVVFLKVVVPKAEVRTATDHGVKEGRSIKELFYLKDSSDNIAVHQNNFDEKWIRLRNSESLGNEGQEDEYACYVFGYSETLAPGESTTALFDKVQLINVVEGEIDNSTQTITVDAYAIQDANIISAGAEIDLTTLDEDNLQEVYQIFFNQNEDEIRADDLKNADKSNELDLVGKDLGNVVTP
ncbi:MAG: hypothetical protein IJO13_08555 [Lachnospiraceae bacterium]|nr:hypothetical protein [Lachnospiraceae bacterium]